jgi:hypothetical protein
VFVAALRDRFANLKQKLGGFGEPIEMCIRDGQVEEQHVLLPGIAVELHQRLRLEEGLNGAFVLAHDLQREPLLDQDTPRIVAYR